MISARYTQLKSNVINMKSLDQHIKNPVIVGGGEANGRSLRIIFTQEAEAMITPNHNVYLKWFHQNKKIRGYELFKCVSYDPMTWEVKFPKNMLHEGTVLASIELVDEISIAASTNFQIKVLSDPWGDFNFEDTEDFSVFQDAVVKLNSTQRQAEKQLEEQKHSFETMQWDLEAVRETANESYDIAQEALAKVELIECDTCVCDEVALEVKITEF